MKLVGYILKTKGLYKFIVFYSHYILMIQYHKYVMIWNLFANEDIQK